MFGVYLHDCREKRNAKEVMGGGAITIAITTVIFIIMRTITKTLMSLGRDGALPSIFTVATFEAAISAVFVILVAVFVNKTLFKTMKVKGLNRASSAGILTLTTVLLLYIVFKQFFSVNLASRYPGYLEEVIMSEFMQGVSLVAHLSTFLWCAFGASLGIILGALPGLTATMGIALVIPISYQLDTATGIGLLLAVYCGAVCGASIPAILLGIPGNPNAIATAEDGQLMTKKGWLARLLEEPWWLL